MLQPANYPRILPPLQKLLAVFFVLVSCFQPLPSSAASEDIYNNIEVFSNVLHLIQQNYVDEVEAEKIIDGAIKGMLNDLDPHSSFLKPEDFRELQVETKGSFTGIGIEITMKNSILTVVSPIEGTPAHKMGLKAGDRIVKIDGEATNDLTFMEAVKKLRGPKGSKVTISIHREGWTQLQDITLIRDIIPIQSVRSRLLEPGFGYIRITNFQSNTDKDVKAALKELIAQGNIRGLILDLRNNPGGLLEQAVQVSDIFLEEGVIVSTRGRLKNQNLTYKAHSSKNTYDFPMIVLVNEGSASASEIVAGALKDHKRALTLGARTFGKGSVQTIIPMSGGRGLRLTTARYFTPDGTSIQAKGIEPDIAIPSTSLDPLNRPDEPVKKPQFLREKDLRNHIKNGNEVLQEQEEQQAQPEDGKDATEAADNPENEGNSATTESDQLADLQKELAKDAQLRTALFLLKGFEVFDGFRNASSDK